MKRKKEKRKASRNIGGKLVTLLQLILSAGLAAKIVINGMFPAKYLLLIVLGLILLFEICFGLQFVKNKMKIVGILLSLVISAGSVLGVYAMSSLEQLLASVAGGGEYKTDSMIVVVRADDPAESIEDTSDYPFAIQTRIDQKNNNLMLEELETQFGDELNIKEYDTVVEEARALLAKDVDAAIYNMSYETLVEDEIKGYLDQVKILYQYDIKTELQMSSDDQSVEEPFHIYISGIDVYGDIDENSRSDVNMIMTVNPVTKKILLTNTPRDYYVPIPGVTDGMNDKLTHAGLYGIDASISTLEQLYGIDITYYARVNFTSVEEIVDALGGIVVWSDNEFDVGNIHYDQGYNYLEGYPALMFARERESFLDGDNQRGKNQQAVIEGVLDKVMSPAILTKANHIIASVADNVETNMSQKEMTKFINMQLKDGAEWEIESVAVEGMSQELPCYSLPGEAYAVTVPDYDTVNKASMLMSEVMGGN